MADTAAAIGIIYFVFLLFTLQINSSADKVCKFILFICKSM